MSHLSILSRRVMLVCLLLLGSIIGCSQTTPEATETTSSIESPQAGWKNIVGEGIILSLPQEYEGGNPSKEKDIDEIEEILKAINPSYAERFQRIKQNPAAIALLAFDTQSNKTGLLTNVNVTIQKVDEGVTVEKYLERANSQLSSIYKIEEQEVVSIDKYRAGRIVATVEAGKTQIKQLVYTIKNDDTFWVVTYAATADAFNQQLPNFETSIQTFRLQS
ncbi:MAG: hypothetical protein AB4426_22765 [Xenococcaceae cyanobacterium]